MSNYDPNGRGLGRAGRAALGVLRRAAEPETAPGGGSSARLEERRERAQKTPAVAGVCLAPSGDQKGVGSPSSSWNGSGGRITGRSGAARTTTLMPRSLAICVASAWPSFSVLQW